MERDPLRLAWKTSPLRHVFGFCLLALAGLCLLIGLELIRTVVDQTVSGGNPAPAILLRVVLTPPANLWPHPLVLFPGITLNPEISALAPLAGMLIVPGLVALLLIVLDWVSVGIGSRALGRLRALALDSILKAPPSAQEDVSIAAALAAHGLARENSVLGLSLLVPVKLGGMIMLALAYVLAMDWRLGIGLAVILGAGAVLNERRALLRFEATAARHREGEGAERILAGLEQRIPAMRAHGTGFYERDRVRGLLMEGHRPVARREYRLALVDSTAAIVLMLAPIAVLALGAWFSQSRPLTAGMVAAGTLSAALAAYGVREIVQWHRMASRARALLGDVARSLSALRPGDVRKGKASLPENGALVAQGVSAYDPASGARITGVNLNLAFPSHVALVGDGDSGPRLLAALMSGQIHPSVGRMTYGGVDLIEANPYERSQRIAFAGETVLIEGSLRENLLYGCHAPADELEHRLSEAIAITGLDRLTHARGCPGRSTRSGSPRSRPPSWRRAASCRRRSPGRSSTVSSIPSTPRATTATPPSARTSCSAKPSATPSRRTGSPRTLTCVPSWKPTTSPRRSARSAFRSHPAWWRSSPTYRTGTRCSSASRSSPPPTGPISRIWWSGKAASGGPAAIRSA